MKKILIAVAIFLVLIIGCTAANREISQRKTAGVNNARKTTLVLNRDENIIFALVKARVKVCGREEYVEIGRGESIRVDVPVGKCVISTEQGWHSGSYSLEINAESGKVNIVRISPRGDYKGATEGGFIGTVEERVANSGKSGPFELVEVK